MKPRSSAPAVDERLDGEAARNRRGSAPDRKRKPASPVTAAVPGDKSQTKATKAKPAPGHAAKTSPSPERVASSASRRAGSPVPNNPHGLPDKREELRTSKRGAPIKEKPKSPRAAYQRELMAKRRAAKKDKP